MKDVSLLHTYVHTYVCVYYDKIHIWWSLNFVASRISTYCCGELVLIVVVVYSTHQLMLLINFLQISQVGMIFKIKHLPPNKN